MMLRVRGNINWLGILSLLLAAVHPPVAAQNTARTDQVRLTLTASLNTDAGGTSGYAALAFVINPGWHIYWVNPGDSGASPTVRWQLPAGWQASDILWPTPERIPVGPLTNYGYADQVTLLAPLSRPVDSPAKGPLVAAVDWLVCKVECLPQTATLRLEQPTGASLTGATIQAAKASLPSELAGRARYSIADERFELRVPLASVDRPVRSVWMASEEWGRIAPTGPQRWQVTDDELVIDAPVGDLAPDGTTSVRLLLVVDFNDGGQQAWRVTAHGSDGLDTGAPAKPTPVSSSLIVVLLTAFAGGLILNLMPCVLPVLSIKVLSIAAHAHGDRPTLIRHGLWFGVGVLSSFGVLAATLLALRSAGEQIGWGFQLQSPTIVAMLAGLMLLVALNLSDVYEVGHRVMGLAGALERKGPGEPFFNGVLATLVATPCTAPLMGAALGYALTQPALEASGVFIALGAGFAAPLVALCLLPGWSRYLPKPGAWMNHLRQWLALPMYGASLWLIWVLSQQVSSTALAALLAALWSTGVSAWCWGHHQQGSGLRYVWVAGLSLLIAIGLFWSAPAFSPALPQQARTAAAWSSNRVSELRASGRPVFVNFTAAWCITCKVNEQIALSSAAVTCTMAAKGVAYLTGDWTRHDPLIAAELSRFGRSGVPLYLLYPADPASAPKILPALLTEQIVLDALKPL